MTEDPVSIQENELEMPEGYDTIYTREIDFINDKTLKNTADVVDLAPGAINPGNYKVFAETAPGKAPIAIKAVFDPNWNTSSTTPQLQILVDWDVDCMVSAREKPYDGKAVSWVSRTAPILFLRNESSPCVLRTSSSYSHLNGEYALVWNFNPDTKTLSIGVGSKKLS